MTPKRVLIVDDSFVMRALLADLTASDSSFAIVGEAENGRVAIERAKETKPDVILLDIEMPEMDGIEALKRLRLLSKAQVIIVSSLTQVGSPMAAEAKRLGAFAVIAKPSGTLSLDIDEKKGTEIVRTMRKAVGLDA